jgi:Mrp family chromosome partitioning ATPase
LQDIELQKTIKSLEFIEAKILGFVLNDVNEEKENSYKYKYKGKYNNYYYK